MDGQPQPTLLLTRPQAASERFLGQVEAMLGHRIPAVISPVLEIQPVADIPDIGPEVTLIFTSGHAVEMARDAGVLADRKCLTIGERTTELAKTAGADAEVLGEDIATFIAAAEKRPPESSALHLRGVHSRGDLASRLGALGWDVSEAIVYDQKSVPLSRAAERLLSINAPVVLPVFSPRSARFASSAGSGAAPLHVIAMSEAVAQAWQGGGSLDVLKNPTSDAMTLKVAEAFRRDHLGDTPDEH